MIALTPTDSLPERLINIPDQLVNLDQWVCWRTEAGTKIPYSPETGQRAKCNDKHTWTSFAKAVQVFADRLGSPGQYTGISFALAEDDPFVGFDFDDCITGDIIAEPVRAILARLGGYAEVSPSGLGVKCWTYGKLPTKKTGKTNKDIDGYGAIEAYQRGRFFTVTGREVDRDEL